MKTFTEQELQFFGNYKKNDPQYKNEVEKYKQAVPSRDFIKTLIQTAGKINEKGILKILKMSKPWQIEAVTRRLFVMCKADEIFQNSAGDYAVLDTSNTTVGSLESHAEGYAYIYPKGADPIYISPYDAKNYLHHDEVEVQITGVNGKRGQRQGKIIRLVKRTISTFIGRISIFEGNAIVIPENKKIAQQFYIPKSALKGAKNHDLVRAEIVIFEGKSEQFTAKVLERLGQKMNASIAILEAILEHHIPDEFSKETLQQISQIPDEVLEEDKKGRKDYRNIPLVTIDGITARDFDDAVYCEKLETGGFKLIVAIADVAHYVTLSSPLDEDALSRGTSVYFPDKVIPMLPEKLSNGLCSLNPDVDRLCMVCELEFSAKGERLSYDFFEGVMRSHARLTYDLVYELIQGNELLREDYADICPHIDHLYELFNVLRKVRDQRGSIDFDTKEAEFEFDHEGMIEKIIPRVRNDAHMIIEECMIAANIAAANFLDDHDIPTLYRVHPHPPEERLQKLKQFLKEFNIGIEGNNSPEPKDYAKALSQAVEKPEFNMIQLVMLRSLAQAVYQPGNEGHFGLALDYYAHFTSPIRRYPDLIVHRGIKYLIHKKQGDKSQYLYDDRAMAKLGIHLSDAERRADSAENDVTAWLKCQYMSQHVGEIFGGKISSITKFGMFIELDDVYIEGLIHISKLPGDFYHFDEVHHRLIGEKTGTQFRLNDHVVVRVTDANIETRFIDFELISSDKQPKVSKDDRKVFERPKKEITRKKKIKSDAVKKRRIKEQKPSKRK